MSKLSEIEDELAEATRALVAAEERLSIARSEQCSAINRVNQLQKAFSEIVAEIKDCAPHDTDWKLRHRVTREA